MLVIALAVLALLVVLGTAFAQLMRLERKATENYVESIRMDMLLDSALDRVVADLLGASNFKSWTEYGVRNPPRWLNKLPDGDLANGRITLEEDRADRAWKWEVFSEQLGQTYAYKTKVIDCSAQINLNGRQDTLARMLDNLGKAIDQSSRLKLDGKAVVNPMYTSPNRGAGGGQLVRGANIVQLRRRLPEGKFTSKSQLKQIIGPENYEILKDFVTVHSWEDPYTYKPTDGMDEVIDPLVLGSTGGAGGVGGAVGGGGTQFHPPPEMPSARIASEPRHPININTAPREVLIACLWDFGCRRAFPYSSLGGVGGSLVPVDQNAQIYGERILAQEEYRDVRPRLVYVYTPRLTYEHALRIADEIDRVRKMKPFMTWRTNNEVGQTGFEDFIDSLDASFFPSPDLCEVIDSDMPANTQLNSLIKNPQSPVGVFWAKGHGLGNVATVRTQLGLAMHERYAWYYDTIKGGLKANFNPNSRLNRSNPNAPAFNPVDKSDLVTLRPGSRLTLLKGHTTEFCFDANGIYEITTLARIARKPLEGAGPRTGVGGALALDRPDYEKKQIAVVKVFDVLRHTSQFHFEKTFSSLSYSSKNNRKYVVTWPEPMAALTELHTAGSLRDGRVELAGINDGQRLEMSPQMRMQYFASFPSVLAAIGFQDRTMTSYANLRRLSSTRALAVGIAGDEYSNVLKEVLNAYSKAGRRYGEFYSRVRMQSLQVFNSIASQWYDPLVEKEVMGTDLYPDGLSTNILRMNHLQSRHLVIPARGRLGGGEGSSGDPRIGESLTQTNNTLGNVPYYKGGIAFWVKFEFDGSDPVFSGLIGCTQVIRRVPYSASDYKGAEGTQFFIFKNSIGQLRVVRMYYHQAFLSALGDSSSGSDQSMGYRLFPDPGISDAAGGPAGGGALQNPIIEFLDPKKLVARSDIVVEVRHFKAHEWHHVAVEWDDENLSYPVKIYLDFKDVPEATPRLAQANRDLVPRAWVRLNERQPKDGLQIGGIVRDQGVADAGVFKWFTNTTRPEGGGAGVQVVAQNVKRLIANATIDEVITFEGSFLTSRAFYGGRAAAGYFSVQPGEYANVFEVPLPPDADQVILRTLDWTSYYPTLYTDSRPGSVPQAFSQKPPIVCQVQFRTDGSPPGEFSEPWRQPTVPNRVAGRRAFRGDTVELRRKVEVAYRFTIPGYRAQTGNQAGGVVQTPAIDDVTLTYFLPHPKVLLVEEDD